MGEVSGVLQGECVVTCGQGKGRAAAVSREGPWQLQKWGMTGICMNCPDEL